MRCALRNLAEEKNIFVETVVDLDEFRKLAREDGWSLEELFVKFRENGASSVSISEDTLASLELEGKITVLTTKEIRKLSLEEAYHVKLPVGVSALAGLWVHSDDDKLLDRITQHLSWKLPERSLIRVHRNLLLINKSGKGITEKVGLGFSKEYFEMAEKAGLGIVVRMFNYPGLSADGAYKMINHIPSPASVSALLFADEEMLGARGDLKQIVGHFKNRSYRIGWIEFDIQDGIKEYLKALSPNGSFVRVHSITRKEMDYVYNVDRAVARWVRAVKDRSLKMLYFRCFFQDEKKYIANLTEFNLDYLRKTVKELNKAGFVIAQKPEERLNDPRHIVGRMIPAERLTIGISLILGAVILLKLSFFPQMGSIAVLCFAFVGMILFFVGGGRFVSIAGLVGAVSYSCIGYVLAGNYIEKSNHGFFINVIRYLLLLVCPSIVGGVLIAGMYSNVDYMLKFQQFQGIKLAFILPLVFTVLWSLKRYGKNVFSLLQKPVTIVSALLLAGVMSALALYLIRSGNTLIFKPTAIEDSFRTFLENTLIARPRNKEFLVGYPSAVIFVMMLMRKEFVFLPLMGLFIQMGQVSVVNTLCHFHTPIKLSFLRIANGLWLGALVGFVAVLIWRCIQLLITYGKGKQKRVCLTGYFGFGNTGDELLRETYTHKLLEELKDYSVSVLVGRKKLISCGSEADLVSRQDFTAVIEELIKCEAIVVPGGGVFQSVTSCRSLIYYLSIVWFARLFGTKVILPAQGLGPWSKGGFFSGLVHRFLAKELQKAEYLTVRDGFSVESFKEITSVDAEVERTTDLAFLYDGYISKKPPEKIEYMKICVVLRSSVKGAFKLAQSLIQLAKDSENLEIIPVAFQSGEDTRVWRKAGWTEPVKNVEDFDKAFEGADLVISMRLHGCIIATNKGIPWVGIAYDPKVKSFAENCDWSEYCCEPSGVNAEYIEACIDTFAYQYQKYSEKLTKYAEKMHKRSIDDFARSVSAIKRPVMALIAMLFMTSALFAEGNGFSDFRGPIDPETGKEATLEMGKRRNFRPKLPDFSEMRKKATKTESEGITSSETVELSNISQKHRADGNPALATATALFGVVNRLASETATAVSQKVEEYDREPSDEELLNRRRYRPGRIKSFYLERREEEKQKKGDF